MDQIITLLSNLFNLTKVASITLPGIALAAASILLLYPPNPIDTIHVPMVSAAAGLVEPVQEPCSNLDAPCSAVQLPSQILTPACRLFPVSLNIFDSGDVFDRKKISTNWPWENNFGTLAILNLFPNGTDQRKDPTEITLDDVKLAADKITEIATVNGKHPWQPKIIKQYVLEATRDRLIQCVDLETAASGQEAANNDQLTKDIANIDKQRSDIQDAYTTSLTANDKVNSASLRRKLSIVLERANDYRARFRVNLISLSERSRRQAEIKEEQENISARLAEPNRIRPMKELDAYVQGLVNHIVGFILLSIALSLVLVAFDRTVLGNLFESLFPGW